MKYAKFDISISSKGTIELILSHVVKVELPYSLTVTYITQIITKRWVVERIAQWMSTKNSCKLGISNIVERHLCYVTCFHHSRNWKITVMIIWWQPETILITHTGFGDSTMSTTKIKHIMQKTQAQIYKLVMQQSLQRWGKNITKRTICWRNLTAEVTFS